MDYSNRFKAHKTKGNNIAFKTLQKKLVLLSTGSDPKTSKGNNGKWLTAILYMLPDDELCPMASMAKCAEPCLNTAGLGGVYNSIQVARSIKSDWFKTDRKSFMAQLCEDIKLMQWYCKANKLKLAIRLNGTSDIAYENVLYNGKTFLTPLRRSLFTTIQKCQLATYRE